MADGGSITVRLGLAGSDAFKAALASLGPVGANALRQIEQAQKAANDEMMRAQAGIEIEMQLAQARAAGDAKAVQGLQDQLALMAQVDKLRAAGLTEAEAQSQAEPI